MRDDSRDEHLTPTTLKSQSKDLAEMQASERVEHDVDAASALKRESKREDAGGIWEEALASLEVDLGESTSLAAGLEGVSHSATSTDVQSRFHYFQQKRDAFWHEYARWGDERTEPLEDILKFYGDWSIEHSSPAESMWPRSEFNTQGFYFRWNGFGIAVNPSKGFLEQFHKEGHFIGDLNTVLCTRPDKHLHESLEHIYALNARCNRISERRHRIDYYLCVATHKELFHRLEPRYKQERDSLHRLDKYIDSEGGESITLHRGVQLSYFYPAESDIAGILIELKLPDHELDEAIADAASTSSNEHRFKFAYLPSELCRFPCPEGVVGCALVILSLRPSLAQSASLPEDCEAPDLATLSEFLTNARAKMALLAEFPSGAGDLRLEVAKHLKVRMGENGQGELFPILPADGTLQLEMATWRVQCAVTKSWVPAPFVHVVRREADFGPLHFMSSDCVL